MTPLVRTGQPGASSGRCTHVGCASPPGDGKDPNGRVACGDRRCCRIDNRRHRSPAPRERASNVASAAAPRHGRAPDLPSVRPVIASPDPEPDGLVSVGSLLRREGRRAAHAVDRPLVPRARDLLEAGARTSTHRAAVAAGALLAVTTVLGSNALGDGTFISGVGVDEAADAGPAAVPPPAEPLPLAAADAPVSQVMAALQSAGTPVRAALVDGPIGTGLPGSATVSGAGIVAAALGAPAVDQGGTTRSGSSSSDDDGSADDAHDDAAPTTARRRAGRRRAASDDTRPRLQPRLRPGRPRLRVGRRRAVAARRPPAERESRPAPARHRLGHRRRIARRFGFGAGRQYRRRRLRRRLGRRIRRRHRGRLRQPSVRRRRGHRRQHETPADGEEQDAGGDDSSAAGTSSDDTASDADTSSDGSSSDGSSSDGSSVATTAPRTTAPRTTLRRTPTPPDRRPAGDSVVQVTRTAWNAPKIHTEERVPGLLGRMTRGGPQEMECPCSSPSTACHCARGC